MADIRIRKVSSKMLYKGRVADLSLDRYQTGDGKTFLRETIRHPASVVILPLLTQNQVVLIRQFRHALGRYIYEIPAGTSEPGEPLLTCAKRELGEEAGYQAKRWKRLHEFYPAPGISTERMVLYRASHLSLLKKPLVKDHDEYITTYLVPAQKAIELVRQNKIIDAKSIIGILFGLGKIRW